jgi:hypothetical protein
VRQRHLARHRHLAAADQPRIGDGMMGRAKRAGRDQGRAGAGEAGDAMDARGLDGLTRRYGGNIGSSRVPLAALCVCGTVPGWPLALMGRSILLPIKTWGFGTEYTVADTEGGQPCTDGNGMPKPKR